jgi:NAD(P)H-hydrate epimerase
VTAVDAPPDWLEVLLDARQMGAVDAWAVEGCGIPVSELMERAGKALAGAVAAALPEGRIAIVCGKGNNGGDGLVAARRLRITGRPVDVILVWPEDGNAEVREQLARLPGPRPLPWTSGCLDRADGIVDAVLGTGARGPLREPVAQVIEAIAARGVPVVSADVPSGVDASTGEIAEAAVTATATVTFHRAKPGLWIAPGKQHAGQVVIAGLQLPPGGPAPTPVGVLRSGVLGAIPRREAGSTKFTSGNVVVIGGSRGLTGAPTMSAMAAQRAGAGYVTVAVPARLEERLAGRLLEAMTVALPDDGDGLGLMATAPALAAAARADAVVLGPGLGRRSSAQHVARELAARLEVPLLVDADGLNAHAGRLEGLARRAHPTVLTPHAGELARLLGTDSQTVERARLDHARRAAEAARAIVVLKGDDTIVAAPDGRTAISPGGAPALATAGTGDVLAGTIGSLLAKRMDPWHAACAGVYAHVIAGRLAAERIGADGVIASDVIAALPAALAGRR